MGIHKRRYLDVDVEEIEHGTDAVMPNFLMAMKHLIGTRRSVLV
jgi:hypothetical protein